MKEYFVKYDIASKTQTVIEDGKVTRTIKFKFCPYIWFGKFKEEIESGIVKFVIWKKFKAPESPVEA